MERTLAIIKPDGVEAGLVGRVLARIEEILGNDPNAEA